VEPLPSKCACLCRRRAFAIVAFAIVGHYICLHTALVFAIDLPLPSKAICHRGTFAFKLPLPFPLPSWGL
jgi:hypothetical protein